ncbi:MAG: hypothetical protein KatS3mg082_2610 [Nitrospiraceae bacterium]|nr:MAG: hypothetical protein KatS3mg082_2610 [Nitrospiraceae bacterium]
MRTTPCPRCAGFVIPGTLEGKGQDRWVVLPASRCINCGWYGGERVLNANQGWWNQLRLRLTA